MLIIFIFIELSVLAFVLCYLSEKKGIWGKWEDELDMGAYTAAIVGIVGLFVCLMMLAINATYSKKTAISLNKDYLNLKYYVEHKENYKEKSLIEHINEYNVELRDLRAKQSSLWLNWFYSGDISQCDYIILEDNYE